MMRLLNSALSRSAGALKTYDQRRAGVPGEHWLVMGLGLALLMASQRSRSFIVRTAGSAAGSALLYRAASGRDGLAKMLDTPPVRRKWLGR